MRLKVCHSKKKGTFEEEEEKNIQTENCGDSN